MSETPTDILLTRPQAQSEAFAQNLRNSFGDRVNVLISPLLQIVPVPNQMDLSDVGMLLFTSANGVKAFVRESERRDIPCACVGEKTKQLAESYGLKAMSADGDIEGLLQLVLSETTRESGILLHVRGLHTAGNITVALAKSGRRSADAVLYDQREIAFDAKLKAALQQKRKLIVPLFSRRTAEVFLRNVEGLDPGDVTLICMSENVAATFANVQFARVITAARPTAAAMLAEIMTLL